MPDDVKRERNGRSGILKARKMAAMKKWLAACLHWCHKFAETMRKALSMWSFRNQTPRRVWAVICLIFFLAVLIVTSSESLHRLIHPDADCADHDCAVTMLAQGHVSAAAVAPPVLVAFLVIIFFLLPPLQSALFSSFDYCLCCSRGPPLV